MFGLLLFLVRGRFLCKVTVVCSVAFDLACSCSVLLFSCVEVVFKLVVKLVFGICEAVSICILSSRQSRLCLNVACYNLEFVCLCFC